MSDFKDKMHQIRFRLGRWGSLQAQTIKLDLRRPLRGREGEGKERREQWEEQGRGEKEKRRRREVGKVIEEMGGI